MSQFQSFLWDNDDLSSRVQRQNQIIEIGSQRFHRCYPTKIYSIIRVFNTFILFFTLFVPQRVLKTISLVISTKLSLANYTPFVNNFLSNFHYFFSKYLNLNNKSFLNFFYHSKITVTFNSSFLSIWDNLLKVKDNLDISKVFLPLKYPHNEYA